MHAQLSQYTHVLPAEKYGMFQKLPPHHPAIQFCTISSHSEMDTYHHFSIRLCALLQLPLLSLSIRHPTYGMFRHPPQYATACSTSLDIWMPYTEICHNNPADIFSSYSSISSKASK